MAKNIIKTIPQLYSDKDTLTCNAKTYLGNRGYCIYKNSIDNKIELFIRKELLAKPKIKNNTMQSNIQFPIYLESNNKFYVPRYFGIKYFGYPKDIKLDISKKINVKFIGELRDYQNT